MASTTTATARRMTWRRPTPKGCCRGGTRTATRTATPPSAPCEDPAVFGGRGCPVDAPSPAADLSSAAPVLQATPAWLSAPADIDGDGSVDLIVATSAGAPQVKAYTGANFLAPYAAYDTVAAAPPRIFGAGDIDNDGDDDLAVETAEGTFTLVFLPLPGGAMEAGEIVTPASKAEWTDLAMAGDPNADADADLWIADSLGNVELYETSGPVMELEATFTLGATAVEGVDLDGDGLRDLIAAQPWTEDPNGVIWVARAPFAPIVREVDVTLWGHPTLPGGETLASGGDLDGDGLEDLLVGGAAVSVVSNPADGDAGLFDAAEFVVLGANSPAPPVDLDGDGQVDVVWSGASGVGMAYGPVSGTIDAADAPRWLTASGTPPLVATGDLDADGLGEIVLSDPGPGGIYVVPAL